MNNAAFWKDNAPVLTAMVQAHTPERVEELEERLVEALAQERAHEERLPTVSQGHATAVEGQGINEAIEAADQSMYATKRSSR